jgi:arylsulfatase
MWVHEGGIATPLIVHWPAGIAAGGELRTAAGHVIDLAPTILNLAGGEWPGELEGRPLLPHPGRDLAPTFADDAGVEREYLWWLHQGNRAIRVDDWKLVAERDGPWELYDLAADRMENHDLASRFPERVSELEQRWLDVVREFHAQALELGNDH